MAVCTEETVTTVNTKRLNKRFDIKEVKCVKCSLDNSFLLVQKLDFTLYLIYPKTGQVHLVGKDVWEFAWSKQPKTVIAVWNPTFSILQTNGNVEVLEVKEKSVFSKQSALEENLKDKVVNVVGSLSRKVIDTLLADKGGEPTMKSPRLVHSEQKASNDEDRVDLVTLLFDGYLLVVLSFSVLNSSDLFKCFEMSKHVSLVPFILPQQTITDMKLIDEILFILYNCGVIVVYNLANWTFYGWIDVFVQSVTSENVEEDNVENNVPKHRPVTKIMDVSDDMSMIFICDVTNNVVQINLIDYYHHFPNHRNSHDHSTVSPPQKSVSKFQRNKEVMHSDAGNNFFGDPFWRNEIVAISRETERPRETALKGKESTAKKQSNKKVINKDDVISETSWSEVITSPSWMEDFTCVGLYCSTSSFLLWLRPTKNEGEQLNNGVLCCYSESDKDYFVNVFMEETAVACGGDAIRPVYLLTCSMIGLPMFGTTQNDLVNKIIVYENVAMAEKLCYLNDWDHFAVPISALEAALKHEQLDTVAFYLKTKGKAFTTIASESEVVSPVRTLSPLSPGSFQSRQLYTKSSQSEDVLEQITSVVNLLLATITTSSKRKHSVQFTSQLLQMSFDYVNGLMQDAVHYIERQLGTDTDRERIRQILSYLTAKTMELRMFSHCIPAFTSDPKSTKPAKDDPTEKNNLSCDLCSDTQEIIFQKWSTMDDKDVIGDAILSRQIPLAQLYFLNTGQSFSTHDGSLSYFVKSGMDLVLEALASKNISTGTDMLRNMGENEVEVIKKICLKTFDRPLRDFLIEQLLKWNELHENEINAVRFLKSLESIYDSQSLENCLIRQLQHSELNHFNDLGLLQRSFNPTSPTGKKKEYFQTGSIAPEYQLSMVSRDSGGYCEVLLDWVIEWDEETRERVLLEVLLHEEKDFWSQISEQSCWQYLKAYSKIDRIIDWISVTSGTSEHRSPPLSFRTCGNLSECTHYVREVILDEVTRNGLYSEELLQEFPLLLRHLCRTEKLFNKVHPLKDITEKDCQNLLKALRENEKESVHSMRLFHGEMVEYCSKYQFMRLLYYYLDFYRLCYTQEECEELVQKNVDKEVDLLLQFRLAGLFPSDAAVICSMSFSNSSMVLNTSCSTVQNMLSNGRPIMAVATCLYAPIDISQMITLDTAITDSDVWKLDENLLKSTLSCYPRLRSALFPRTGNQTLSENPDINLYELLQGNCPFELSSLFTWQSTNSLAARGGLSTDMPHFSQKNLVEKFAHKETLTYWYFLKHGRPSFAFITFLSKHQHCKYVPKTSISKATTKAYQLAITHFGSNKIVNSCVAFLELLGVDTTFVRIDIEAARRILQHGNKDSLQCTNHEEFKSVIVKHLLKWIKDKSYKPKFLLAALEISTRNVVSKEGLDRSSREASQFWSLPIMFCRSHNLTLTPAFLIDCAKADKWLMFLCHAQLAQFPKDQVLSVLQHHFENNHVKEHLHHALINVVTVDLRVQKKRRKKSTPTRRDVRSQYLSRVIRASPVKSEQLSKSEENDAKITPPGQDNEPIQEFEVEEKKDVRQDELDDEDENEFENQVSDITSNDINPETSPDNLFDVLSLCNETNESWRAILAHCVALKRPLFAVLAACYKDVNLVDCMCVWLYAVHDKDILDPLLQNIADVQWNHWTLDDLLSLIVTITKYGVEFSHFLSKAFYLFDPNNLLLPLMRFYEAFALHFDFEAAGNQLSDFVTHHKALFVDKDIHNKMVIGDLVWCEKVANGVVENVLRSCETIHTQVHLLRLLYHSKFGNGFSIPVVDFKKLYNISRVLEEGSVFAQCINLTSNGDETERILGELLNNQKFTEAREFAKLVEISSDKISLRQIMQKKNGIQSSQLWTNERERILFWESCDRYLEEQECSVAGEFFEEESKRGSVSTREKATLLCIANHWFSGRRNNGRTISKTPAELAELEHEMWLCILQERIKSEGRLLSTSFICCQPQSNLLQKRFLDIEGDTTHYVTDQKMKEALKEMIGEMLDEGQVTQARQLSVIFGISTTDLDIVLTCIFLAQEILSPEELDEDIKSLLTPRQRSSLSNNLKLSGGFTDRLSESQRSTEESSGSTSEDISSWSMVSNNLAAMKNLASSCQSGKICCFQVIVIYKISQTLGLHFDKVVCLDYFDLLCSLLGSSFDQRYKLAAQYIKSFDLDPEKVAQFVAKSISMSLKIYSGGEVLDDKVLIFNPSSREDMTNVICLVEDKLVLGGVLFEEALVLARKRKTDKPNSSALVMEVELLICAHRCQTIACNTEGISSILKMAQICTHALAEANEYQLMVRLLTGIGRFTEMTYIFQALMDHHHFELLVKKSVDNENKLKIALLNYLDKHYTDDTEKHLLVAYRFSMHREVAVSLKTSADSQVKTLVKRGIGSHSEVKSQLVSIARSYTYAMENFKEEGCLLQALECAKKHRLVELQSHLLPTGLVILGLNNKSLAEFLAKYNNFFEAYIVADAYNKRSLDTWIEPIFNHVILGGDFKYFNEICSVFQISNTILSEIGTRYRSELQRNATAMTNMKKIIHCERDIVSRYKIALELGYREEVENIRQSEAGALVRDLGY